MQAEKSFISTNSRCRKVVANCLGGSIIHQLKKDLEKYKYSFTLDTSTVSGPNICALKVRYLKPSTNNKGPDKIAIQSRVIGLKYLGISSTAETFYYICKEKLSNLSSKVQRNFIGYVHDHTASLSGVYSGLGVILKANFDQAFFDLDDPCHSLNLVVDCSLKLLPKELIKFIEEAYNHFRSPQREAFLKFIQVKHNFKVLGLR